MVPCGTYLNYDEDIDILVEFYFMFIQLELIGFSLSITIFFMAIVLFYV